MFAIRRHSHVRNITPLSLPFFTSRSTFSPPVQPSIPRRWASSKSLEKDQVVATGPVAERLTATGLWAPRVRTGRAGTKAAGPKSAKSRKKRPSGDKSRVNIVSEGLCDDIFSYIGPTLDRHKGCDIIDIYPGAGLWSQKLNHYLKPRSHILMEPDIDLYKPFLQPLLDQPGTIAVPKSGIIWRELNSVMSPEYLPHQVVTDRTQPTQRNDTLLVTANLAFHPMKRYRTFDSMALLVLHQFIDAIRTSGLFQRYGQVRMLIWTRSGDKSGLLPQSMQKRKRMSIMAELSCEWVREVCGPDGPDSIYTRDVAIDMDSNLAALRKMRAAGMKLPEGREPESHREARATLRSRRARVLPGVAPPTFKRRYQETLAALEADHGDQVFSRGSEEYKTMKGYRWRQNWEEKKSVIMFELMAGLDAIAALRKSPEATPEEIAELEAEWHAKMQDNPKGFTDEFITYRDNLHYYRQDPPLLAWDQREYDPMVVRPDEFFPNVECCLLDIQPKQLHPLLRETGPKSSRAADSFEVILSGMMVQGTQPISRILDTLSPGAADYIMPRWKSVHDMTQGGIVSSSRYAELTPRLLNPRQWEELLELWMEWPFRPEFHELLARNQDDAADNFEHE